MKRLLILLMLVSQPVWADWVKIGTSGSGPDDFAVYGDPETIRKTTNGRRAWMMWAYQRPQTSSFGTYQSTKFLREFDCEGERTRTLQSSYHSGPMGEGQTVFVDDSPGNWRVVSPRSIGEIQLQAVCSVPLK